MIFSAWAIVFDALRLRSLLKTDIEAAKIPLIFFILIIIMVAYKV